MSGPITAGYVLVHGALVLSARALAEARAMKREYDDVRAQLAERERALDAARRGQRNARLERVAAMAGEAARLTARIERLRALGGTLATQPALAQRSPATPAPVAGGDDDRAWSVYLRELQAVASELESVLASAHGAAAEKLRTTLAATSAAPSLDDVLAAYVQQRQLQPGLDAALAERFRATAARVLSRLPLAEGATLPHELEALARAIVLAPSGERAEALASELRLAVQHQRDAQSAQADEAAEAKRILDELPADAPEPLVRALAHVAAGGERMDAALRAAAQRTLEEAAAGRERAEHEAAALVLQESLRDLGYEVDDIGATLFADGGTVHFRRAGWERYCVRLRVDANERTVNFNVVRARGDDETAERRRQDVLAEDRWCAEFPRLMQTLAARGLTLDVTRRLGAGEIPVQVVDAASLPLRTEGNDDTVRRGKPRARELP